MAGRHPQRDVHVVGRPRLDPVALARADLDPPVLHGRVEQLHGDLRQAVHFVAEDHVSVDELRQLLADLEWRVHGGHGGPDQLAAGLAGDDLGSSSCPSPASVLRGRPPQPHAPREPQPAGPGVAAVTNGLQVLWVPRWLLKVGCTSTMTGGGVAGRTLTPEWSVAGKLAAILTSLSAGGEYALTELVHWTGLPMSTAHRLVHQLVGRGLLERTAVSGYSAGPVLGSLTTRTPPAPPTLSERGPYVVEDLADTLHRRVGLGVRDNLKVAYIEKSPGHLPVTSFSDAARLPAHATAVGKVLLAFASPNIVRLAVGSRLPAYTAWTEHCPNGLQRTLREERRLGYATDVGELHGNSRAVAVPVLDFDHIVIAAIETSVDNLAADTLAPVVPALTFPARCLGREITPLDEWAVKTAECAARRTVSATKLDSVGIRHHRADADEPGAAEITRTASRTAAAAVRPACHGVDKQAAARAKRVRPGPRRRPTMRDDADVRVASSAGFGGFRRCTQSRAFSPTDTDRHLGDVPVPGEVVCRRREVPWWATLQ
jgi:IclR family transcriptional regulator, acetate operon repressor